MNNEQFPPTFCEFVNKGSYCSYPRCGCKKPQPATKPSEDKTPLIQSGALLSWLEMTKDQPTPSAGIDQYKCAGCLNTFPKPPYASIVKGIRRHFCITCWDKQVDGSQPTPSAVTDEMVEKEIERFTVEHYTRSKLIRHYLEQLANLQAQLEIKNDALEMISKICKSSKHKDPISDILCECNRANRLTKEMETK